MGGILVLYLSFLVAVICGSVILLQFGGWLAILSATLILIHFFATAALLTIGWYFSEVKKKEAKKYERMGT